MVSVPTGAGFSNLVRGIVLRLDGFFGKDNGLLTNPIGCEVNIRDNASISQCFSLEGQTRSPVCGLHLGECDETTNRSCGECLTCVSNFVHRKRLVSAEQSSRAPPL
jgi:hypothetical protein